MSEMDNFIVVSNNHALDNALIGATAKLGCIIQTDDWFEGVPLSTHAGVYPTFTKPAAAFQLYVSKKNVPAGTHSAYEFIKYRGYTTSFTYSLDIKASVGTSIMGCDTSFEVSTGFRYGTTIETHEEQKWYTSVDGGDNGRDYWTYQVVILYATQVRDTLDVRAFLEMQAVPYQAKDGYCYYFAPVYRDSPSLSDRDRGSLSQSDFVDYLLTDGWNKWFSTIPIQASGHWFHQGSGSPVVAKNGETGNHTNLILFQETPSAFNSYILTKAGYLYHIGSGKPVVAENGSTDNHTNLILFSEKPAAFNSYNLTPEGFLYHRGSGKFVVAKNGETGNHTNLILFEGTPSAFNSYRFR